MSHASVDVQNLELDEIGRVVLTDRDLDNLDIFEGVSAGGANGYCDGTANGSCTNTVTCSGSENIACNNMLNCSSTQNSARCAVPNEIEP